MFNTVIQIDNFIPLTTPHSIFANMDRWGKSQRPTFGSLEILRGWGFSRAHCFRESVTLNWKFQGGWGHKPNNNL